MIGMNRIFRMIFGDRYYLFLIPEDKNKIEEDRRFNVARFLLCC